MIATEFPTDAEVLEAARRGDSQPFAEFFNHYRRQFTAAAWKILQDEDDTQDALQEGWLRTYRSLPGFRGEGGCPLVAWTHIKVVGMARNIRESRQLRRSKFAPLDHENWQEPADHRISPDQSAVRKERAELVAEAIETIREPFRATLHARFVRGLKLREIAAERSVPLSTIAAHITRGEPELHEVILKRPRSLRRVPR